MRMSAALAVVLGWAAACPAQEAPRLRWDHEGQAALAAAAGRAKAAGVRLLLGLSGSPT